MLEALKSQDLLILGTEDEADTEEEPGESLSKFQNVIEQFIEQNSPETSKSTADHDTPSRSSKNNHVNTLRVKKTFYLFHKKYFIEAAKKFWDKKEQEESESEMSNTPSSGSSN